MCTRALESCVAAADRFNQLADGQPTGKGLGDHVQVYPAAKGLSRSGNGKVATSLIRHRHGEYLTAEGREAGSSRRSRLAVYAGYLKADFFCTEATILMFAQAALIYKLQ